jgi:hypothetical protein
MFAVPAMVLMSLVVGTVGGLPAQAGSYEDEGGSYEKEVGAYARGVAEIGQTLEVLEGTWTARYAGRRGETPDTSRIHLQFDFDTSNMGQSWPASELPGLDLSRDADNIVLELRREAGTIKMSGNVRARRGFGIFDFVPNGDFASQIGVPPGRRDLTNRRLFALAVHNVSRAWIQQLDSLGYRNLDLDDLLAMRIHGVTPEFITEMRQYGFDALDHEDLVAARIHGATPAFLRELGALGYSRMAFKDVIAFRIHGVTPDFIQDLAAVGYAEVPAKRLIAFRIHGVDAEFVKDLKEKGFANLTPKDLVDARIHGRRWMRQRQ